MSTSDRPLVRVLCLPDVDRPIGGVKQLYRHVEHLVKIGWDAAIVTHHSGYRPSWFQSFAPTISLRDASNLGQFNRNTCVLVVPETYVGATLENFWGIDLSSLARVVFNQNAYYTYGSNLKNPLDSLHSFYDHPNVLQVLSVSEDTHQFLNHNLGIPDHRLSRIVNAVESIFKPDCPKKNKIHWMPRKNADHVQAVLLGMQRCNLRHSQGWHAEPLQNLTHQTVAGFLNEAKIFLSFGHPEGFGLPIAEAMAAGCWVVGYSGFGGDELFRYGASHKVSFGNWRGFLEGIQDALDNFAFNPKEAKMRTQRQALAIRSLYSLEQEFKSIATSWECIAKSFLAWSSNPVD